jgi:hypothetical protein
MLSATPLCFNNQLGTLIMTNYLTATVATKTGKLIGFWASSVRSLSLNKQNNLKFDSQEIDSKLNNGNCYPY